MRNPYFRSSYVLAVLALATSVYAQGMTIPEMLAREGSSLGSGPSIPSGPPPSLDRVLTETDTIIRGVVGEPRSYLSDDQREVYTDYPIRNPVFLYQAALSGSQTPEIPTATVTLLGGTFTINGLSFTSTHAALPTLEPGTDCVFLLKQVGSRYNIAGRYYGAFRATAAGLTPLTEIRGFAPEFRRIPVAQAAQELVNRISSLRARQ